MHAETESEKSNGVLARGAQQGHIEGWGDGSPSGAHREHEPRVVPSLTGGEDAAGDDAEAGRSHPRRERGPSEKRSARRDPTAAAWADFGDPTDSDALVYNAFSVTPQVLRNFYSARDDEEEGVARSNTGELASELVALRSGRAQLGWRLCNPFHDRRLGNSLLHLAAHTVAVIVVLSCFTCVACWWTSHAARSSEPWSFVVGERPTCPFVCGSTRRTSRELKSLLLSIDIPMFLCVATSYCLAMANLITALSQRCCRVVFAGAVGVALVLTGTLVVALSNPQDIWGNKGSVGFAGIWVAIESAVGISTLVVALSTGNPERRLVRSKASALRFGVILLGSALLLQSLTYLVEILAASGIHSAVGIACLFAATFVVLSCIKQSMRQWIKVPPLACTFLLYWFQAGAYMSFRLFLQAEESTVLVVTTVAAAVSEIALRVGIAVTAKLMYNFYVRRNNAVMALRALDVHIATLLVDILAEWAAIAIAGVLGAATDSSVFEGLRISSTPGSFAATMGLQVGVEVVADVVSLVAAFTILPISLEGLFKAPGHGLLEIACGVASCIFVFTTLNMRLRIDCFVP